MIRTLAVALACLSTGLVLSSCFREAVEQPDSWRPITNQEVAPPDPQAPARFKVEFTTTVGKFTVTATRQWAPLGVDRFHELVKRGYYQDIAFFRVIDGFMAQFGIHGDPKVAATWHQAKIQDDPVRQSNTRGTLTYATAGPGTRTTQMFLNFGNNASLDRMDFAPIAKVTKGMAVVDAIYKVGDGPPGGSGPNQAIIRERGNAYLKKEFPQLTYITAAAFVK